MSEAAAPHRMARASRARPNAGGGHDRRCAKQGHNLARGGGFRRAGKLQSRNPVCPAGLVCLRRSLFGLGAGRRGIRATHRLPCEFERKSLRARSPAALRMTAAWPALRRGSSLWLARAWLQGKVGGKIIGQAGQRQPRPRLIKERWVAELRGHLSGRRDRNCFRFL